ncbi:MULTISPECIES: XRE family transcriptional regulator [unclassified Carboxylicivirga]|uniref:XRE family transcriptional regulator n=1 Tax=Carboxylicivirga TaxID=1628153 RepID=UPI003D34E5FC
MHQISSNIIYLRQLKNWSQRQAASQLKITLSTYRKWEKGQSQPKLSSLEKIIEVYKRTIDELLYIDLQKADKETPEHLKGEKIRILPIVVDEQSDAEHVSLVPVKAAAGYTAGYADAEFIADLPRFSLPFAELSQHQTYRVFQIEGDSMLPIKHGAYIICEYTQNWEQLKWGEPHIVITREEGVVFKRLHKTEEGLLELKSDNPLFDPYSLPCQSVMEVWRARGYVCFDFE